ncbi:MAG: histidinol dehydrogenase [Acholeplasmataceae bacterium]
MRITTIRADEYVAFDEESIAEERKIRSQVIDIIDAVRTGKDRALRELTKRFDGVPIDDFRIDKETIDRAYRTIDPRLRDDLERAYRNIVAYHEKQLPTDYALAVRKNCSVGQMTRPIDRAGLYVPGGTAQYPSTVLMNAVPAKIAGVREVIMISPPDRAGKVAETVLAAAKIVGIERIYRLGGAQGIAALAYGTESIPRVDKIVGPGNIYVTTAKKELFGVVGIDMIAGPTEVVIYADERTDPRYVAADLLAQAEHDARARAILITSSRSLVERVNAELKRQSARLYRQDIIGQALSRYGQAILVSSASEARSLIDAIAPEHLEVMVEDAEAFARTIRHAGSIFIGPYSPEPLGDYMSGTNHTLPTNRTARFASPLGVADFMKRQSFIHFDREGLKAYRDSIVRIARSEGLDGHANAIEVRFDED